MTNCCGDVISAHHFCLSEHRMGEAPPRIYVPAATTAAAVATAVRAAAAAAATVARHRSCRRRCCRCRAVSLHLPTPGAPSSSPHSCFVARGRTGASKCGSLSSSLTGKCIANWSGIFQKSTADRTIACISFFFSVFSLLLFLSSSHSPSSSTYQWSCHGTEILRAQVFFFNPTPPTMRHAGLSSPRSTHPTAFSSSPTGVILAPPHPRAPTTRAPFPAPTAAAVVAAPTTAAAPPKAAASTALALIAAAPTAAAPAAVAPAEVARRRGLPPWPRPWPPR